MARKTLKDFCIDDMKTADLPEVSAIETASFTMPWSQSLFMSELHNPLSVSKVAKADGKIVGYICFSQVLDEGHVLTLAVHPEFRRCGIASVLLQHALDLLKTNGCRHVFIEVRGSNEKARRLYERFNFKVISIRKNYYIMPLEDAVIMVLDLAEC